MSCIKGFIDPIFFVRWHVPEVFDFPVVLRDVAAARKSVDHPIAYIALAGAETLMPDDKARSGLAELTKSLVEVCETVHLVLEGDGFKQSLLRSAATGIFMISGKRGKVFVQATLREALETAAVKLKFDPAILHRIARQQEFAID